MKLVTYQSGNTKSPVTTSKYCPFLLHLMLKFQTPKFKSIYNIYTLIQETGRAGYEVIQRDLRNFMLNHQQILLQLDVLNTIRNADFFLFCAISVPLSLEPENWFLVMLTVRTSVKVLLHPQHYRLPVL